MTLHEIEIAALASHPKRVLYVPGHGVLALWIDDESPNRLCEAVEPAGRLSRWAQDDREVEVHLHVVHAGHRPGRQPAGRHGHTEAKR